MSKTGTNVLFMAVGAALGAAVTYVATSEKKEEWLRELGNLVDKVKTNIQNKKEDIEEELEDLVEDAE